MIRWLWVVLVFATGCPAGPVCDQDIPCDFAETCFEGQCVRDECVTSEQCSMEARCDAGVCVAGCGSSVDCFPGDQCGAEGVCEPAACEETQVDCGFREFCDVNSGTCFDAGDRYCQPCSGVGSCGDANLCLDGYCGVDCSGGRECPSGFICTRVIDEHEVTVGMQCMTDCWVYEGLR
jgi:hypothetical protein